MILVTGGAGLVGKALISQLLSRGKTVRAIYNKTPLPVFEHGSPGQIQCDIMDVVGLESAMQDIDQVYHCAALVSFNPRKKAEMFKINIEGTANIVNAALEAGVSKLVHVSSVAALGRIRVNETVNEKTNWTEETNNSNYGKSKYLGELEVWRGVGEGLEAVIVNPSVILGAGDWKNGSSKLFKSVYDEFPWYTTGTTGFVGVEDVAKAMIQLMESNISGERFILSAENKTYQEVLTLIANAFGKKPPHKKVTPGLAAFVWRWEALKGYFSGEEPLVTKETALTALAKVEFDNSKILKSLPAFKYQSISDIVLETCRLFTTKA